MSLSLGEKDRVEDQNASSLSLLDDDTDGGGGGILIFRDLPRDMGSAIDVHINHAFDSPGFWSILVLILKFCLDLRCCWRIFQIAGKLYDLR